LPLTCITGRGSLYYPPPDSGGGSEVGSMVDFDFEDDELPSFFNTYAGGVISTEQAYSGTRSVKCTAAEDEANLDWLAGKPLHRLTQGDEIWVRFRTFFPTGYDFSVSTSLKFLRVDQGANSGVNRGHGAHIDYYLQSANDTDVGFWNFIQEDIQSWMFAGAERPPSGIIRNTWQTWNFYLLLHSVASSARVRLWCDETLIIDSNTRATLGAATNEVGSIADGNCQGVMFMTYWNGGSPQAQSCYLDDWAISTNISGAPTATDGAGNPWIGL